MVVLALSMRVHLKNVKIQTSCLKQCKFYLEFEFATGRLGRLEIGLLQKVYKLCLLLPPIFQIMRNCAGLEIFWTF